MTPAAGGVDKFRPERGRSNIRDRRGLVCGGRCKVEVRADFENEIAIDGLAIERKARHQRVVADHADRPRDAAAIARAPRSPPRA